MGLKIHHCKTKMPGFPIVLNSGLQVEPAPDVGTPQNGGKPGATIRGQGRERV
jgi:hypothetical protein